jgi:GrpB-like predicted nucleotidyltransferase (UPF0157 family)
VSEPPRIDGPIELADYDPAWPQTFEREAARIRGALGSRALRVEHVGSTSVPGLAAKPCVDILLVVGLSAAEPAYVPDLERAGYRLVIREENWSFARRIGMSTVSSRAQTPTSTCTS